MQQGPPLIMPPPPPPALPPRLLTQFSTSKHSAAGPGTAAGAGAGSDMPAPLGLPDAMRFTRPAATQQDAAHAEHGHHRIRGRTSGGSSGAPSLSHQGSSGCGGAGNTMAQWGSGVLGLQGSGGGGMASPPGGAAGDGEGLMLTGPTPLMVEQGPAARAGSVLRQVQGMVEQQRQQQLRRPQQLQPLGWAAGGGAALGAGVGDGDVLGLQGLGLGLGLDMGLGGGEGAAEPMADGLDGNVDAEGQKLQRLQLLLERQRLQHREQMLMMRQRELELALQEQQLIQMRAEQMQIMDIKGQIGRGSGAQRPGAGPDLMWAEQQMLQLMRQQHGMEGSGSGSGMGMDLDLTGACAAGGSGSSAAAFASSMGMLGGGAGMLGGGAGMLGGGMGMGMGMGMPAAEDALEDRDHDLDLDMEMLEAAMGGGLHGPGFGAAAGGLMPAGAAGAVTVLPPWSSSSSGGTLSSVGSLSLSRLDPSRGAQVRLVRPGGRGGCG